MLKISLLYDEIVVLLLGLLESAPKLGASNLGRMIKLGESDLKIDDSTAVIVDSR